MDVDIVEDSKIQEGTSSSDKKFIVLPVDEAHPFDLESYISNYSGENHIRCLFQRETKETEGV